MFFRESGEAPGLAISSGERSAMTLKFHTLDVFTQKRFSGNPVAVVLAADDLSDQQMQTLAREFNLSETVFVQEPANPAHTAKVRIFTPARELPFAGHPTVGTACLLAERVTKTPNGGCDAIVVLEERIGPVRVGVRMPAVGVAFAEFDMPRLPVLHGETPNAHDLAEILGLSVDEIGFDDHRPVTLSAGVPYTFVPIRDLDVIGRACVNTSNWFHVFDDERTGDPYLYCRQTINSVANFHARMFAPTHGIPEDPATGSAAAAFTGVLAMYERPASGLHRINLEQGIEMGRASLITIELEIVDGTLVAGRVGGHAVMVSEGLIEV